MLPKKLRIKKRKEIEHIFKNGKYLHTDFFILKKINTKTDNLRFAIIISKKVSPKAVTRNHIRLQISEILRTNYDYYKKGFDVIIIGKKILLETDFQTIQNTINQILIK